MATPLLPWLQPIAYQLIAHASLITGRQYVHSLLLMGNKMLGSTCAALQTWRDQQVPRRWVGEWETQVWTVIFKTASVPASQHILRSPFPSFPPKVEQSRCSIPPFERCKATPRSLLEHLVDRSTSHLSSLSHGFGLIFCALLCCSPRCFPRHKLSPQPVVLLIIPSSSSSRRLSVCLSPDPQIPCAAFICSCEEQRRRQVRPSTDINTFFARVIDSLTHFLFVPAGAWRINDRSSLLGVCWPVLVSL